ncbi:MAG: hypothetical protein ABFD03_07060 [Clostridiaceae bacterium]
MKIQASTTQEATHQQPLIKRMLRGCFRFLGTFLFILFMTRNLLVSAGVDSHLNILLPYFVIPSCFICVTIGANYWYGDHINQWRSYLISSIIAFALYILHLWSLTYTNYSPNLLQCLLILALPIVSTVYSIRKLRQAKKMKQEGAVSNIKHQPSKRSIALANMVRLVALISFCCVFLENAQHFLSYLFDPVSRITRMMIFGNEVDVIIAVYAIWLLICFARKEFVQLSKQKESEKDCVENVRVDSSGTR